jgi:hypothetical protein
MNPSEERASMLSGEELSTGCTSDPGTSKSLKKEGGIFSIGQRGVLILQAELHIALLGV